MHGERRKLHFSNTYTSLLVCYVQVHTQSSGHKHCSGGLTHACILLSNLTTCVGQLTSVTVRLLFLALHVYCINLIPRPTPSSWASTWCVIFEPLQAKLLLWRHASFVLKNCSLTSYGVGGPYLVCFKQLLWSPPFEVAACMNRDATTGIFGIVYSSCAM